MWYPHSYTCTCSEGQWYLAVKLVNFGPLFQNFRITQETKKALVHAIPLNIEIADFFHTKYMYSEGLWIVLQCFNLHNNAGDHVSLINVIFLYNI